MKYVIIYLYCQFQLKLNKCYFIGNQIPCSVLIQKLFLSVIHSDYISGTSCMKITNIFPSWEAANCAATQELPSILRNPKVHYRTHKSLSPVPSLRSIQSIPSHPVSLIPNLILPTYLHLRLPSGLFPPGFPTNNQYAFLVFPFVLQALSISPSLTWSL
jgi:hypothetical protein